MSENVSAGDRAGDSGQRPVDAIRELAGAVWWMVLLRGVLIALFGIIALVSPGIALLTLVFLFGFYAILDGIVAVVLGFRARRTAAHWVWPVVQGVLSVIAGLVALVWPGVTALALLFVVAFWAIVMGVAEIAEAFTARRTGAHAWGWTLVAGIVNILFGLALLTWPAGGILTLIWLVGLFALIGGVILIGWAFRVRAIARGAAGARPSPNPA
ncbi:HdeD family acid-resistance protein [Pseudonocardia sp. RS11V-5]|uniref:HdeD family acid-resistance protein n=1 Tax=Pseudonocardia terrae TaxID=2905831 RepID=UPI001E3D3878|nr:HdeD family acid-resistance protein [Pseudonocardia terrae]MCE3552020.1 HdeD family acid-resistance protein [Pseudonocardia terrae]